MIRAINDAEQANYYDIMFKTSAKYKFIKGFGLRDWLVNLSNDSSKINYSDTKKAFDVIKKYYEMEN